MTTVAIFKWAMNPHDERVFNGVAKWAAERPDVGDDDHAVVATALSAANGGEVVGLTTNPAGDLSFAAARGADRTVAIDSVFCSQSIFEGFDQILSGSKLVHPLCIGI